jgi:hypothetical protein
MSDLDQARITKEFSKLGAEKFELAIAARAKPAPAEEEETEEPREPPFCKHPAKRLYAWWANGNDGSEQTVLCVTCLDCGAILRGAADADCEKYCP